MIDSKTKNALSWLVLGLAIAGTAWASYDATNRLKSLHGEDQQFVFGESTIGGGETRQQSLDAVIDRHIFGVVPVKVEKKVVEKPKVINAPKTRLNLLLTGILSASGAGLSLAMIEITRGETSLVAVGNDIGKTGATLHQINEDHVLINHNGKIEKLLLERDQLGLTSSSPVENMTVKEVELSAAELSVLNEVGPTQQVIEQYQNPLVNQSDNDVETSFTDESFLQSELVGQDGFSDDGEEEVLDEELEDEEPSGEN